MFNKITIGILALFMLIVSLMVSSPSFSQDVNSERSGQAWKLLIKMKPSDGLPASVQIAIFDKDPVPDFMERVKNNLAGPKENRINNPQLGLWYRNDLLGLLWDSCFQEVTGDKVLLFEWSANSLTELVLSGGTPNTRKWVVSKSKQLSEKQEVYWCVPVDVENGKTKEVEISVDNMHDFTDFYDTVISQTSTDAL